MTPSCQGKVILVVGSCGLDRLLTVPTYPQSDSKVRSTAYHEIGGGNAANSASAMALLSDAAIFCNEHFCIKLLTKVGDDYIGQQLKNELDQCGVDTSLVCRGKEGSTTSFTTILVSQKEHTRTCIHTPGTSGNFSIADLQSVDLDDLFRNVFHLHSDSRLAEVSLLLAKEAQKRNIPISVDAEKDRHVEALDHLLEVTDLLFTNSTQIEEYLERWTAKFEMDHDRLPLPKPVITVKGDDKKGVKEMCALGIAPSSFFQRWFEEKGSAAKEVVITKGHLGALHVCCESCGITKGGGDLSRLHELIARSDSSSIDNTVVVKQRFVERNKEESWAVEYNYKVHHAGVMTGVDIVDTTGAGDAFIGAYILTQLMSKPPADPVQFGLKFGAWVGGKKLGGPGARSALPTGIDVDTELGDTTEQVQSRLQELLQPFGVNIDKH